jgi:DNA-binding NtrC family response regulator
MKTILLIDDDKMILLVLKQAIHKAGYNVITAESGEDGIGILAKNQVDLVLTDYMLPGMSGIEVLGMIKLNQPLLPVIILTGHGDVALTIKAIQLGAFDYLEKPVQTRDLLELIHQSLEISEQNQSVAEPFTDDTRKLIEENTLIGKVPVMRDIFKNIGRISLNRINVLLSGETGTGKELIARLIHHSGVTRDFPFVVVNCSSLNDEAIQNELFGYQANALPGIAEGKIGKFESAGEGTLFLDEISNLSENLQIRLLRVIEEREFEKPGAPHPIALKARIVASTNKDLEKLISIGKFREELFYRLKVFTINLPPLRRRKEDIRELTLFFMDKYNRKLKKDVRFLGIGVMDNLMRYNWPGNIRELENSILEGMIICNGNTLKKEHLSVGSLTDLSLPDSLTAGIPLDEMEKIHIQQVLTSVKWSKKEAARVLGISRPTLNVKIEKYKLMP